MKVALVHDWLTGMRGGEKCLEIFCRLYPEADLYTLLHVSGSVSPLIEKRQIRTSFLQLLPGIKKHYRYYLPLMPLAIQQFDLSKYDLILSSSHCVAKGVSAGKNGLHICYCFTPMRYIWDQYHHYFGPTRSGFLISTAMHLLRPYLKKWDIDSSQGVNHFIAISKHVEKRIQSYYRRKAEVVYPPVDTKFYAPTGEKPEDFFLIVSAFAPYKRLDLAVEAFGKLGYPLKIIGSGQELSRLKKIAAPNIEFLGWLSNEAIRSHYARCRAFIFPGEEDFGITPLEAQGMGRPVIAYSRGGVLETVVPEIGSWKPEFDIPKEKIARPTGVFFHDQTPGALISAVQSFESIEKNFDPEYIRNHASQFDVEVFSRHIQAHIENQFPPRC